MLGSQFCDRIVAKYCVTFARINKLPKGACASTRNRGENEWKMKKLRIVCEKKLNINFDLFYRIVICGSSYMRFPTISIYSLANIILLPDFSFILFRNHEMKYCQIEFYNFILSNISYSWEQTFRGIKYNFVDVCITLTQYVIIDYRKIFYRKFMQK